LAREKQQELGRRVGGDMLARAQGFLHNPGISVLRDAEAVRRAGRPHAMHDPTEGGLATGLWEMAAASGKGVVIDQERVPVFPETATFCRELGLDPLGLIASGALLVAAAPQESAAMLAALQAEGIGASIIGRVVDGPPAVYRTTPEGPVPLPKFARDELGRVFEETT
jgi:hydrogenase expression/formation protein HypE